MKKPDFLKKSELSMNTLAVWLFPAFAVLISGWLFYDQWYNTGPLLKIHFSDAVSVEPQKTTLRFRGITVGKVERVKLSEDTNEILVFARLDPDAEKLAVEGARFWIVQPRVDFEGVSGLETLFRGPYIRVEPGKGAKKTEFTGISAEALSDDSPGTVTYYLRTTMGDSVDIGDPITYRGVKIGSVSGLKLDGTSQFVNIRIGVERKYDKLIRNNSFFWRKLAIHAKLGLFNSEVKINSLETLLKGGITMAIPDAPQGAAQAGSTFPLLEEPPKNWINWAPKI